MFSPFHFRFCWQQVRCSRLTLSPVPYLVVAPSGDFNHLSSVQQASSTSCNVQTTVTNIPAGYLSFDPIQFAQASVSGSYSLGSNKIAGDLRGVAAASLVSAATAQITFSDALTTGGPVRTGIIRGSFLPTTWGYGGIESISLVSPALPYASFGPSLPIAFELGQPFTLTIAGSARSLSDDGTPSTAQFDIPFDLAFFEADGVTPVALTETTAAPEPATVALSLLGIAGALAFRKRQTAP